MPEGAAAPAVAAAQTAAGAPARARRWIDELMEGAGVEGAFRLPTGEVLRYGAGPPRFQVVVHSPGLLNRPLEEMSFGEAYINGGLDIEGDLMSLLELRQRARRRFRLGPALQFWWEFLWRRAGAINRRAVDGHYNYGDDFYFTFLDNRYRLYSHGLFASEQDTLEEACERKLATMFRALELKPGMRLLDIGAGWGSATQFCGQGGVEVTSLTLARNSYDFTSALIRSRELPCRVLMEDFLRHRPDRPYDAVAILGVIEHLPYYRRFAARVWECLKPGGRLYLDASATKQKYDVSDFNRRYVYRGTQVHSFLCLQELIQELLYHGMELVEVRQETRDYELTMEHWAGRLEAAREEIVRRWGERLYRIFRLYLWAGCHAFRADQLQAYHLVARRGPGRGPRPGRLRRTVTQAFLPVR